MLILTINSGSSSLKFQLFDWEEQNVLAVGVVERIGQDESWIKYRAHGRRVSEKVRCEDARQAVRFACGLLADPVNGVVTSLAEIGAVGHRVSHGGEYFLRSTTVDGEVLRRLREIIPLAPLHLPANIAGIEEAQRLLPGAGHTITVDTAWHQTMPRYASLYAVPQAWYTGWRVRRYGFHGTSFLYCARRAALLMGRRNEELNAVICHIGSGASACAVRNGVSFDTTMGFTPQEGLIMGTRCGDLDPSVIPYVMRRSGLTAEEVDDILIRQSGLKGICGHVDRRDIEWAASQGDDLAALAIQMECYRLKKAIGGFCAALGRVDCVVFTAAAGEMCSLLREKSLEGLEGFGIRIDPAKNAACHCRDAEFDITAEDSRVRVFVIPTDEEMVITEDAWALLHGTYDVHTRFRYSFERPDYVNRGRRRAMRRVLAEHPELAGLIAVPPRTQQEEEHGEPLGDTVKGS